MVSDETLDILEYELPPLSHYKNKEKKEAKEWIDRAYEIVYHQILSGDRTLLFIGLCHFGLLTQLSKRADITPRMYGSLIYKKCLNLYPMIRHIFQVSVPDCYQHLLPCTFETRQNNDNVGNENK